MVSARVALAASSLLLSIACSSGPVAPPDAPSRSGAPTVSASSAPSVAAAPAVAPAECAPSTARSVEVASRVGSSIALVGVGSRRLAYVADEDDGAIRTIDAAAMRELAVTELAGRPAQLVALPDGRLAVTLRESGRLVILEPGAAPEEPLTVRCVREVPSEPWGLALSPDGAELAVTSAWGHALTLLDTASLAPRRSIDLPAEPRGVLFTESGEHVVVTHLVGGIVSIVPRSGADPTRLFVRPERQAPSAKQGPRASAPEAPKAQRLATSQGYALTELSLGAGPSGPWPARVFAPMAASDPMLFGSQQAFPAVYGGGGGAAAIDPLVAIVEPKAGAALGAEVVSSRGARPDDCILPRAIARRGELLYVACLGIDAVLELDARSADPIGAERRRFEVASGPTGIAIDEPTGRAFVFSQHARQVTVLALDGGRTSAIDLAVPPKPLSEEVVRGRALFFVTRDVRLSFDGRACASCHPDGRADGLTWATPDGPRQTISLAGRAADSGAYGWFGDHPTLETHVRFTTKRLGGHGLERPGDERDLAALLAYVRQLPAPPRLPARDASVASQRERGAELFGSAEAGCATCHPGGHADGKRHDVGSGDPREAATRFDTPSLRGVAGSAPYFHDGRYATLLDLLSDPRSKMGRSAQLSDDDRRALAAYLEGL